MVATLREAVVGCQGICLVIERFQVWCPAMASYYCCSLSKKLCSHCPSHPAVKPGNIVHVCQGTYKVLLIYLPFYCTFKISIKTIMWSRSGSYLHSCGHVCGGQRVKCVAGYVTHLQRCSKRTLHKIYILNKDIKQSYLVALEAAASKVEWSVSEYRHRYVITWYLLHVA